MNLHQRNKRRQHTSRRVKNERELVAFKDFTAMYKDDPVAQMILNAKGPLFVQHVAPENSMPCSIGIKGAHPNKYSIHVKGDNVTITCGEHSETRTIEEIRCN